MPLTITSDVITSNRTAHTARIVPGHPQAWQVSWLPSQVLDGGAAVTAMMLADVAARGPHPGHRLWPHIRNWAAGLGLTAPAAITLASQPPETTCGREPAICPPGREAADP